MEIVNRSEGFKRADDGTPRFAYVLYFVKQDGVLYRGKMQDRFNPPKTLEQLYEVIEVETENRGPTIQPGWSQIYIKTPSVFDLASGCDLEDKLRREVSVCEMLQRNPHPNIAIYYGCQEVNGRVSGLCFKRYKTTLHLKANPGHLNKDMFRKQRVIDETAKASLTGILAGIKHLHALGLVHNDINPSNVMYDENDNPVLIDFGSCRRIGESLRETKVGRTPYWHDPHIETAEIKNDLDAFKELKTWLVGDIEEEFLFSF